MYRTACTSIQTHVIKCMTVYWTHAYINTIFVHIVHGRALKPWQPTFTSQTTIITCTFKLAPNLATTVTKHQYDIILCKCLFNYAQLSNSSSSVLMWILLFLSIFSYHRKRKLNWTNSWPKAGGRGGGVRYKRSYIVLCTKNNWILVIRL